MEQQAYPYITTNRRIAGGSPIIKGTRITVRTIARYYQMGMSVDEILNILQHLSPSQVHSALAYYFDHQQEIDRELEVSTDVEHWRQQVCAHPGAAANQVKVHLFLDKDVYTFHEEPDCLPVDE